MSDSPARLVKAVLGTIALVLSHAVAALVAFVVLCRGVPVYLRLFDDHEVALPAMTQCVIALSIMVNQYWFSLLVGFVTLDAAILLGLHLLPPRLGWLKTCWHTAVLLSAILFLGYAALALTMPLAELAAKLA